MVDRRSLAPGDNVTIQRHARIRARSGAPGFSIVEIALLTVILLVAIGGLSGAVVSAIQLSRTTEETAIADDAARAMSASFSNWPFSDVFALFNANPLDDPNGPGTALGPDFDVRGLTPQRGDADGRVGRILFPAVDIGGGVQTLQEDFDEPRWGMPRDLSGDDMFDALDQSGDYVALPVTVLLEWTGAGGARSLRVELLLVE